MTPDEFEITIEAIIRHAKTMRALILASALLAVANICTGAALIIHILAE